MRGRSLVCVATLLFVGCLAVVGQCRLEATRSNQEHPHANITANATAVDSSLNESKITLKWCVRRDCDRPKDPFVWKNCYCCVTQPGSPCWRHVNECQANCPSCHPDCLSASAIELHA
uniref:Bowman-Birk serine protease inhibitors family domain-containing protein n=1 Tax=Aegilops tauschii subsp. strangulata TaxID=200361 RepID=A0A452ZS50_AEGTS